MSTNLHVHVQLSIFYSGYQLWGTTHLMHCIYGNHNTGIAIYSACMAIEYQIQASIQQRALFVTLVDHVYAT